jgi:dienelactone hydrolase
MSAATNGRDVDVVLVARDGWRLAALLQLPAGGDPGPGVVLVHGSHHERDAFTYGVGLPDLLADRGVASLRFDIRGRGGSRQGSDFHRMAPLQRRAVALDVAAALDYLAAIPTLAGGQLGLVGEQDTAASVVAAAAVDPRVAALVLLSPRLPSSALSQLRTRSIPTFALVSKEDRESLRATTAAYAAAPPDRRRIEVFAGLGFGTTMFMARTFEQPDEESLEQMVADWLVHELQPTDRPAGG